MHVAVAVVVVVEIAGYPSVKLAAQGSGAIAGVASAVRTLLVVVVVAVHGFVAAVVLVAEAVAGSEPAASESVDGVEGCRQRVGS